MADFRPAAVDYNPVPTERAETRTNVHNNFDVHATPDMFGAQIGAAEEKSGQQTVEGAERLNKYAIEAGHLYNTAAVNDAQRAFLVKHDDILHKPPTLDANGQPVGGTGGYYAQGGIGAIQQLEPARAKVEAAYQGIREGLNPIQQTMFDSLTRHLVTNSYEKMGDHADKQAQEYAHNTFGATANQLVESAARAGMSGDTKSQALYDDQAHGLIYHQAELGHISQTQADMQYQKYLQARSEKIAEFKAGNRDHQVSRQEADTIGKMLGPQASAFDPTKAPGLVTPGNIDLHARPVVKNADGSISTVRSMSVNMDGKEVLIPTVSDDGKIMTPDQAIAQFKQTGKHLGMFDTPDNATAFAKSLHESQAKEYGAKDLSPGFTARLMNRESSGDPTQVTDTGKGWSVYGKYQMSGELIRKFAGTDPQTFMSDPALQDKAFSAYTADLVRQIKTQGLDKYIGQNGITMDGLVAGAHLGGMGGLRGYLVDGRDPADRLGTHISDYVSKFSGATAGPITKSGTYLDDIPPEKLGELRQRFLHQADMQERVADRAKNDAAQAAVNDYATKILTGQRDGLSEQIAKDNRLDANQRFNLTDRLMRKEPIPETAENKTLYYKLLHQAVDDPEFVHSDLSQYMGKLTDHQYDAVQRAQLSIDKKAAAETAKTADLKRAFSVADDLLKPAGINKPKHAVGDDNPYVQFQGRLVERINQWRDDNDGKRPGDEDIRKMTAQLLHAETLKGSSTLFGGERKIRAFEAAEGKGHIVIPADPIEQQKLAADIKAGTVNPDHIDATVPPSLVPKLTAAFSAVKKRPPTPAELGAFYAYGTIGLTRNGVK